MAQCSSSDAQMLTEGAFGNGLLSSYTATHTAMCPDTFLPQPAQTLSVIYTTVGLLFD